MHKITVQCPIVTDWQSICLPAGQPTSQLTTAPTMAYLRSTSLSVATCMLLAVLLQAHARTLSNLHPLLAACGAKAVPLPKASCGSDQETWVTRMDGCKNVKPNTTGILAPMPGPSKGSFVMCLDKAAKKADWTLLLCDISQYRAAHIHTGSPIADYAPPLVPLEPLAKPANPFAPPTALPLVAPVDIVGCTYSRTSSFGPGDILALPDRDSEVPAVRNWEEFVAALQAGKLYVNVHNNIMPAGIIRGNLFKQE